MAIYRCWWWCDDVVCVCGKEKREKEGGVLAWGGCGENKYHRVERWEGVWGIVWVCVCGEVCVGRGLKAGARLKKEGGDKKEKDQGDAGKDIIAPCLLWGWRAVGEEEEEEKRDTRKNRVWKQKKVEILLCVWTLKEEKERDWWRCGADLLLLLVVGGWVVIAIECKAYCLSSKHSGGSHTACFVTLL